MNEFIAATFLPHTDTMAFPQTMARLDQRKAGHPTTRRSEARP
jgi:hypothetical protein